MKCGINKTTQPLDPEGVERINILNLDTPPHQYSFNMATQPKDFSFFEQVYEVVKLIPKGRVTSYGAIARYLGAANSARMVGWAMNASHTIVPPINAQRVVNRNGLLTGKHHFGQPNRMQQLLENDGVKFDGDQILNFKEIFWDPMIELAL